jgi:hypothetical protein
VISAIDEVSWSDKVFDELGKVFWFCIEWLFLVYMQRFGSVFGIIGEVERRHDGEFREVGNCRSRID